MIRYSFLIIGSLEIIDYYISVSVLNTKVNVIHNLEYSVMPEKLYFNKVNDMFYYISTIVVDLFKLSRRSSLCKDGNIIHSHLKHTL